MTCLGRRMRLFSLPTAILVLAASGAAPALARPVQKTPAPSGPIAVPYPDPEPPPTPECPYSLCPKAAARLQLGSGAPIAIESFSWGSASARADAGDTSDPQEGGQATGPIYTSDPQEGGQAARPVYTSDPQEGGQVTAVGRKAGESPPDFAVRGVGRAGGPLEPLIPRSEVVSPRDVSSGMASGKRQHAPVRMTQGSVSVSLPEGICVAGAHYPQVSLEADGKLYLMDDVTVSGCAPATSAKGKKVDRAKLEYLKIEIKDALITG